MIRYDRTTPQFLMVSPTAWTASPFVRWFDQYAIIAIEDDARYSAPLHSYGIESYTDENEKTPKTVQAIYSSSALERALDAHQLTGHTHILNRPSEKPHGDFAVLTNDRKFSETYENKVNFRRIFSDILVMPEHAILNIEEWVATETYRALAASISPSLVVQHPTQSGSRGTYFASTSEEFDAIIEQLRNDTAHATHEVVVSRAIPSPVERSLQICIQSDAIQVGPAQAQLVRNPQLTYQAPGAIQFCGGRVDSGLMSQEEYAQAYDYAMTVASRLQAEGYRGIFGMDYLIGDKVYVIEANLRFTGLSPLLASLQEQTPYMLLHALELSGQAYDMDQNAPEEAQKGSFITVFAQEDGRMNLNTGLYDAHLARLGDGFEDGNLLPKQEDEYFVAMRVRPEEDIPAGKSLAFIYARTTLFDEAGNLTDAGEQIVRSVRSAFIASSRSQIR